VVSAEWGEVSWLGAVVAFEAHGSSGGGVVGGKGEGGKGGEEGGKGVRGVGWGKV